MGAVVTFLDITDQHQMKIEKEELSQRLRQAQRMESIDTLAGGVAHDLNNILSGVVWATRTFCCMTWKPTAPCETRFPP